MAVRLVDRDRAMLGGAEGEAARLAMEIVVAMAESVGAERLMDIASGHIDGALYHGKVSLDFAGRHLDENRRGEVLVRVGSLPQRLLDEDVLYPVLGHLVGLESGTQVPVIDGLPAGTSEDRLKAFGSAAASSGSVGLFHAVGVTPEAPTLEAALQGAAAVRTIEVTMERIARARDSLSTATEGDLDAVSVGTPHFSVSEFEQLVGQLDGARVADEVAFYVSTGRSVLAEAESRGWIEVCERAGVTIVADTCTYVTPILRSDARVVMTNSGKWAYYAPGNLGVQVVFGSLAECVRSAVEGKVWRDPAFWADA